MNYHKVMAREPTFINIITDWNFLINKSAQNLAITQSQQRGELDDIVVFPLWKCLVGKRQKKIKWITVATCDIPLLIFLKNVNSTIHWDHQNVTKRVLQHCLFPLGICSRNFTCKFYCKLCISIDWFSLQPHILKIDEISIYNFFIQMQMKSLPLKVCKATNPSNRVSCDSALPRKYTCM